MPTIKPYTQQTSATGSIPSRYASAADFGGGAGAALEALGSQLSAIGEHVNKVRRETTLANATAKATRELEEYSFTLQNGSVDAETGAITPPPDPSEHVSLYQNKLDEIRSRAKFEIGDDNLFALFDRDFSKVSLRKSFEVKRNVIDRQKATALGEFNVYEDSMAENVAQADPLTRSAMITDYRATLQRLETLGVITPVERAKRERDFAGRVDQEQIRETIRVNPEAAIERLMAGDWKGIDPVARQKWIDTAITKHERDLKARNAERERAEKDAKQAQQGRYEANFRDAIDLAQQGKLTVAWVRSRRDDIAKADYDALMKMAAKGGSLTSAGGEGRTNKSVYADLRIRAGRGEDVRGEARRHFLAGSIKAGEFSSLTTEVETNSPEARAENWPRQGKDRILAAVKPDPANKISPVVLSQALDDWQRYTLNEGKSASPQERERTLETIISTSTALDDDAMRASLIMPKFMQGTREQPNIAQIIKRTKEAYERGEISKFEFDREGRNIQRLAEYQKRREARKPKADKKGK